VKAAEARERDVRVRDRVKQKQKERERETEKERGKVRGARELLEARVVRAKEAREARVK